MAEKTRDGRESATFSKRNAPSSFVLYVPFIHTIYTRCVLRAHDGEAYTREHKQITLDANYIYAQCDDDDGAAHSSAVQLAHMR